VQYSIPPGTLEGIQAARHGAVGRQQDLQTQFNQSQNIRSILEGMETDLNTRGVFSGAGATSMTTLRQIAQSLNLPVESEQAVQGQSAQEQFNKLAAQLEAAQMTTMGNPSDARQAMAAAITPSLSNTREGNLKIIHMLEGNQMAIDTMYREFNRAGLPPSQFDRWKANFTAPDRATGGEFDPRVFWMAQMPPRDQQEYAQTTKTGNPRAWARLSNNLQYAKTQGWIFKAPDGGIGANW